MARGRPVSGVKKLSIAELDSVFCGAPRELGFATLTHVLGVSRTTLRIWCIAYGLPHRRFNGVYIINCEELKKWLVEKGRAV